MSEAVFDPDLLGRWGDVELVRRASTGYVNEVWFALVDGDECVVRAPKRSNEALQWEIELLDRLGDAGVRVPEVVLTRDGATSAGGVVVFRRVEGDPPTTAEHWALVRDYLQRVHDECAGIAQRPGFLSSADLLVEDVGGLVDLRVMPDDAVARCRAAWARLAGMPQTVVHADPGAENIFVRGDAVVLIDWDEARADVPLFDLAALPDEVCPLPDAERWVARQAASAWEAAITWSNDREYALWRLSQVDA